MPTSQDLIAAVNADDAERVAALVAEDPGLAAARDENGVSAVLLSRYRFSRPVTDALLAADPISTSSRPRLLGISTASGRISTTTPALANAFATDGFTPLHLAAFFGKAESTRVLLDAGAEVNVYSRNDFGVQPLHSAAAGRHHEVCRLLVAAGADLNARQREDYTPLHEAARRRGRRARRAVPVRRSGPHREDVERGDAGGHGGGRP